MFNDKMIIDLATTFVYQLDELTNKKSKIYHNFTKKYKNFKIIDIHLNDDTSNLGCLSIIEKKTNNIAIIFQGSNNLNDWRIDNLNNLLNKPIKQYEDAYLYTKKLKEKYHIIYCAGNSLGGGCAQYVGTRFNDIKVLCINASPLLTRQYHNCDNITHLRINADPLYRFISFDQERLEYGYSGDIILIKRSCYGFYDYFNHLVIAHAGAIYSSLDMIKNHNKSSNLMTLNNLNLSDYLSYDLISNNLNSLHDNSFNIDIIQNNFEIFTNNYDKYINNYLFKNIEDNNKLSFIKFNKTLNKDLKYLLKKDLLKITLKDEITYRGIYFIIDMFTKFIYHSCLPKLNETLKNINTKEDLQILKDNTNILHDNYQRIQTMLIEINNQLKNYHKINILSNNIMHIKVDTSLIKEFNYDYQKLIYNNIKNLMINMVEDNKVLIDGLSQFIKNIMLLRKASEKLPILNYKQLNSDDIDYLLSKYNVQQIINNINHYFYQDIEEIFLTNSLLYIYDSNILLAKEYLIQVSNTLTNLLNLLNNSSFNINKYRLKKMIWHTINEVEVLLQEGVN
ncbi:MAG: hypothetical protein LBR40_00530 [Bacilli bacterium]|nr:hypothetical protein [Bacilli bacterium]